MKKQFKVFFLMFLTAFIFSISFLGGKVTASASGNTVLNEKNDKDQSESVFKGLRLNVQKKSMVTDSYFQLKLYNMRDTFTASFKSSDSDVVSVTEYGCLTAHKSASDQDDAQRTATISVTVRDSETDESVTLTCDITVGPRAESVKFICADTIYLKVGEKTTPSISIKPKNSTETPVFISFDPSIVKAYSSGKIVAKKEGSTEVVAMTSNGRFSMITVVVTPAEETEEESKDANVTSGSSIVPLLPAFQTIR